MKAYSYYRFSRPEQAKGTSIERQRQYAEQYALDHDLVLDTSLTMTDKGLSAFHGVHKSKGALGRFLVAVEQGIVQSGSVLIVESLDRLSREEPLIAQSALTDLILAGITVVTASDNQVYSREEIQQNPFKLIMSLVVMIRANEESETKQQRSNAFIQSALKQYQQNGTIRRFGADPKWLDFDASTATFTFNDKAIAIKRIIELYKNGIGTLNIARTLTEEGIPTPSGKRANWGHTTVHGIIKSTSLYGNKRINIKGVDHDLNDYYPALIEKTEWLELQQQRSKRTRSMHGRGEVVHLITGNGKGFSTCSKCGGSLGAQTQKQYKRSGEYSRTVTRLHCLLHKETGSCNKSVFLKPFEDAVLFAVTLGINPQSMITQSRDIESEIKAIDDRIKHIVDEVANGAPWSLFSSVHDSLVHQRKQLAVEKDSQSIIDEDEFNQGIEQILSLSDKAKTGDTDSRLKVKSLIKRICTSIVIDMSGGLVVTFTSGEQLEMKLRDESVVIVDSDMAINKRLLKLRQD